MFSLKKLKKSWQSFVSRNFKINKRSKKFFWSVLFLLSVFFVLTIDLIPHQTDLKVGEVSKKDIIAPRTVTFVDEEKTAELKKIAAQSAPRVYEEDVNVNNTIREKIKDFFTLIRLTSLENGESQLDYAEIQEEYGISKEIFLSLVEAQPEILDKLEKEAFNLMDKQLSKKILPDDQQEVKDALIQEAMETDFNQEYRLALASLLENLVRPNMILNEEATLQKQEEAMQEVEPYLRTIKKDEAILRKGDVVTEEDIKALEVLGLQKRKINYLNISGIIILTIILIGLANYYFYKYKRKFWQEEGKLIFLELMVIIVLILAKIIALFQNEYMVYLVPVAMASILTTVLIAADVAIILTVFLSFLVALVFDFSFQVVLVSFVGGLVGIFSASRVNQRNDLVRAGFYVSGVLFFLILGLSLSNSNLDSWFDIALYPLLGILNGVLAAILANGLLPYLENSFGLTSAVKLLELSNPSQPLLKSLLVEAPGTYHHSVIVGNLAETAAENIGANALLARVGAYYHDIGKMKRPYFFTDNQFGGSNPHDTLSPNLSSLIIKSHVKEGVELAREYKLPEAVVDIIKQHHGTNLISYFYQQALQDSKHANVKESDFRYDGPKPQSREAAIIMLADIVEAAVRSKQFNKKNHNRIEGVVRELVRNKLIEGQLDESGLTLSDLDKIVESFVKILTGIYHQRIDYPENILKEIKRADKSDKNRD